MRIGNKYAFGALAGLAGALLGLGLWTLGVFDSWEARTWDWRARSLAGPGPATDEIRLILLDQNSLDWAREENGLTWPWPREMYAAIIDHCRRAGAKALALDVLFTEPSAYGVSDDERLGGALERFGPSVGTVFLGRETGAHTRWPEAFRTAAVAVEGIETWLAGLPDGGPVYPRALLPIAEVGHGAALLGNVHLRPDPDGIYRRVSLIGRFDGKTFPSLGLALYLASHPVARMEISEDRLSVAGRTIPMDRRGRALLRYRGPTGTHRAYSAAAVLESEIRLRGGQPPVITDPDAFRDKYVLFGFSAPGLHDLRPSPAGGVYTGVEIHATLLDNYLSGDFMREVSPWVVILLTAGLCTAAGLCLSRFGSAAAGGVVIISALALPVLLAFWGYLRGVWLPLVAVEASAGITILGGLVVNYATEGRQKRFIKGAFRHYLSPAVIEQLIQDPGRLTLGGERRVLSIFFSDIEGFTSISEKMDPEALTHLLNDYLSAMSGIIQDAGGTIDKYEGDAVIAFWNAPLEDPRHAVRAVRAALRCQAKLAEMGPGFQARIGKPLRMRIGINTGPAVVGNLGSNVRFDYTMLGDSVNLASRLEGVNKQFGSYTLISEFTKAELAGTFPLREMGKVLVVGRSEPVRIYEPLESAAHEAGKEIYTAFEEGLKRFYDGRFREALEIFDRLGDADPPARAYGRKCRELLDRGMPGWDGVWRVDRK